MPITFGPLDTVHGDSAGGGAFGWRASGVDVANSTDINGASYGALRMQMRASGEDEGAGGEIVITIPDTGVMAIWHGAAGADAGHTADGGKLSMMARARGADLFAAQDAGGGEFSMRTRGMETVPLYAYGFYVEQPATITGYGGVAYETFSSGMAFNDALSYDLIMVLESVLELRSELLWVNNLYMTLTSSLTLRAAFDVVFEATFEDTLQFAASVDTFANILLTMADQLVLTGEVTTQQKALMTLASAFVLRDMVVNGQDITVASLLAMADQIEFEVEALVSFASSLELADATEGYAAITMMVSDTFALTDDLTPTIDALVELADTIGFTARFALPGNDSDLYVGYAMNLRNAGMVKYDNFPFTQMATVGGVPLGIGPEGLYRLEGDTDAGAPIRSRVRTGLTDFGTPMLKHVLNSYLGYTADGALVIKVITTDGGRKAERWFKLEPREASSPVEGRFDIAKGLVGLYWGFELVNVDGADFEADVIRVWPFAIQRRKSGR